MTLSNGRPSCSFLVIPVVRIVALLVCSPIADAASQDVAQALRALDGVFSEGERSAVTHAIRTEEGAFHVQRGDGQLRLTVETEPIGVASLCIGNDTNVFVLHASAALGSVHFRPEENGWVTNDTFEWKMRETAMSDDVIAKRAAYLESHGWVATTSSMGDPETTEFIISTALIPDGDTRIAVGVMPAERSDVTLALPTSALGCANNRLVRGYDPDGAIPFEPSDWLYLDE